MRYSQLFGKTLKAVPAEAEAISHQLLIKAGFIDQALTSGVYTYLPLGWRVFKKIEQIIKEEINAIGGQELFMPTLQPKDLWLRSDRWDHIDPPLFKLKDRHEKELAMAPTHEEVITDLVARFVHSYKDLPLALYHIQNKFRNEMRSTGGLLRVREFFMKDLYSFHSSSEDLDRYYEKVLNAYKNIFRRCGFEVKVVEAVSGTIGGSFSHEFMMVCPTGEDTVIACTKCDWAANIEKTETQACPLCGQPTKKVRSIENGHIFKLGSKYAEKLGAYFTDKDGTKKVIYGGCYGIGLGRLLATTVEAHHDEKGIVWPKSVAPYQVQLISLSNQQPAVSKFAENIYEKLEKAGVEVLYDDREGVSAGEKFADADLIGIPVRLVVSEKTDNKVEWKERKSQEVKLITPEEVAERLTEEK
ncbi:MAG: Proline--tRNA ligase [Microgenomates group bacterium ADurb.Bin219]|nr:MAG: Proline--tRNA ligase [Microgenomates group bacterium ADurb.Bin219]HNP89080.1 proline--tRNA ligase [Candidatus Woesebacteria bacterium]